MKEHRLAAKKRGFDNAHYPRTGWLTSKLEKNDAADLRFEDEPGISASRVKNVVMRLLRVPVVDTIDCVLVRADLSLPAWNDHCDSCIALSVLFSKRKTWVKNKMYARRCGGVTVLARSRLVLVKDLVNRDGKKVVHAAHRWDVDLAERIAKNKK